MKTDRDATTDTPGSTTDSGAPTIDSYGSSGRPTWPEVDWHAALDPALVDAPEEVARLIRSVDDERLRAVLGGELGTLVLDEVFRRFPEYLDPERVAGADAVVEWLITRERSRGHDSYLLILEDGACRAGPDLEGEPRVTLELDAVDFLRLVTGNANPGLMFLEGRLGLDGDVRFALELASFFRVPGDEDGDGVDPTGVDAIAVARLLKSTSDGELRERLRGPVREVVLDEVFRRFPEYLNEGQVASLEAAIQWQITGREDGGFDRYVVVIERGACHAGRDLDADPRVSIRIDAVNFLKLVTGNANPVISFIRGRMSIRGDMAFAAKLPSVFRIPSANG